jgi:hypothetical protein
MERWAASDGPPTYLASVAEPLGATNEASWPAAVDMISNVGVGQMGSG